MNKAFTRETDDEPEELAPVGVPPSALRNYMTPAGYASLRSELLHLMDTERPQMVETVHWAAKNGDRSENGDYLYGKKRLREIDRRIRFLTARLEAGEIVDPSVHFGREQVFFGASVVYVDNLGVETSVTIKGIDEADTQAGDISWISPVASALLRARVGDEVSLRTPSGDRLLEILSVDYPAPPAQS